MEEGSERINVELSGKSTIRDAYNGSQKLKIAAG